MSEVSKIYTGCHVQFPLFLSYCNETWIFSTDFRKMFLAERRKGTTRLTVDFRNSAKAPKSDLTY